MPMTGLPIALWAGLGAGLVLLGTFLRTVRRRA